MSTNNVTEVTPGGPIRLVSERISVHASVDKVWSIVSDVGQMPGLHPQMLSARWLDGADAAGLGVRFESDNVAAEFGVWQAVSRIVEFRPGHCIAWTVEGAVAPATVCRFDLLRDTDLDQHPGANSDSAGERMELHQTYFFDTRPGASPPVEQALAYRPATGPRNRR